MIDSQGSRRAVSGGLFPTEASRKGLAGIVVDGPCRDTTTIRARNIPYYARSVTPQAGTTTRIFETQIPIQCGGVTVSPGDVVFGDDDGLVVATDEEFGEMVPIAEKILRQEQQMMRNMTDGRSLFEMLNFEEHCEAVRAGNNESRLEFRV